MPDNSRMNDSLLSTKASYAADQVDGAILIWMKTERPPPAATGATCGAPGVSFPGSRSGCTIRDGGAAAQSRRRATIPRQPPGTG